MALGSMRPGLPPALPPTLAFSLLARLMISTRGGNGSVIRAFLLINHANAFLVHHAAIRSLQRQMLAPPIGTKIIRGPNKGSRPVNHRQQSLGNGRNGERLGEI